MGLVLGENARFQSRAQTVVDIIIETANGASGTIHNITGAMRNIRHDSEAADVGTEASNFLSSTSHKLDAGAANGGSEHSLHNSHCGCCHCPFWFVHYPSSICMHHMFPVLVWHQSQIFSFCSFWAFEVLEGK